MHFTSNISKQKSNFHIKNKKKLHSTNPIFQHIYKKTFKILIFLKINIFQFNNFHFKAIVSEINFGRLKKLTSKLNSNSASRVQTLTGKDFPFFFLRNGGILFFIFPIVHYVRKTRKTLEIRKSKNSH